MKPYTSQLLQEHFIGEDKNKIKIQDEIFKTIKENWNKKLGYVPEKPMALITVYDPKDPDILKSIGCSEPNDLLTDIFGASLSGMINNGNAARNITNESGVVKTVNFNDSGGNQFARNDPGPCGTTMRVGRGGPIDRSDFNLTDPFVVVPEALNFNVTPGGWLSGSQTVVVNGLLAGVTTSDTIGECGLYMRWRSIPTAYFRYMISHDVAGASFQSGQNVNVTYTWSIT